MKQRTKIICIVLAAVLLISVVTVGVTVGVSSGNGGKNFAKITGNPNGDNSITFKKNVAVLADSAEVQRGFVSMTKHGAVYTLSYDEMPEFFNGLKKGKTFCVYPDNRANLSYFANGFAGTMKAKRENNGLYEIDFTIPHISEVFSDICLKTKGDNAVKSVSFTPDDNFYIDESEEMRSMNVSEKIANVLEKSIEFGDNEYTFDYKKPDKASLMDEYIVLGKKLSLNVKNSSLSTDSEDFDITGGITLDYPAVRFSLDCSTRNGTFVVNDCSLGLIAKQKIDISLKVSKEVGLDELFYKSDDDNIIDIEDVTESEKGKIVLGTYLVGMEVPLPILKNEINKLNFLSYGIAFQLSITAKGSLSLEYKLSESGFLQTEVDSKGNRISKVRGYDYPNPVIDATPPTEEDEKSKPTVSADVAGELKADLAIGADVGLCVLGMLPMKISNNLAEVEITRQFDHELFNNDLVNVVRENNLFDDEVDSIILSSNSFFKTNLGAKVNLGSLKFGTSLNSGYQIFSKVHYQYPKPVDFNSRQCSFGGVQLGKAYTDQELKDAYFNYQKNKGQHSIISEAKEEFVGSMINGAIAGFKGQIINAVSLTGGKLDDYDIDFFTTGVIYIRDMDNVVVAEIVTGEDVSNVSGIHIGFTTEKIEQIYSKPDSSASVDFNIDFIVSLLLGIDDFENTSIKAYTYKSNDSNAKMDLLFDNGTNELKLILLC